MVDVWTINGKHILFVEMKFRAFQSNFSTGKWREAISETECTWMLCTDGSYNVSHGEFYDFVGNLMIFQSLTFIKRELANRTSIIFLNLSYGWNMKLLAIRNYLDKIRN